VAARAVFDTNILIVSGDHHLLNLGEYEGVRVITAAEFVARFAKAEGDIAE
jgi:predicted nucleic acid-binding protein